MRRPTSQGATRPASEPPSGKRRASISSAPETTLKRRRVQPPGDKGSLLLPQDVKLQDEQLPSPSSSKIPGAHKLSSQPHDRTTTQKNPSGVDTRRTKRTSHVPQPGRRLDRWLQNLPSSEQFDSMSQPPSKRSRSQPSDSLERSPSGDGSGSAVSRDAKYSAYKDSNYALILEKKQSFLHPSDEGIVDEDLELCQKLLDSKQPIPRESMFTDTLLEKFYNLLRGRSEARVFLDLHSLLVPSAENLFVQGHRSFENLIQGYNDPWIKAIPFYGPRPQPDHTVGFKWASFTQKQRQSLGVEIAAKSYYLARDDIFFPFLTSEIKCGKQALDLADIPNAHSMTVAVRAIVELYRRVQRESELHRKILGFSISHDHEIVRIYGHYPEIQGTTTAYYRHRIRTYSYSDNGGAERWTTYQFTRNVYDIFAPIQLERIKSAIDQLPDPTEEPLGPSVGIDEEDASNSQDLASGAPSAQDAGAIRGRGFGRAERVNPELRAMIQRLEKQLEQQREDSQKQLEQQREYSQKQLEQQRADAKSERDELWARLQPLLERR